MGHPIMGHPMMGHPMMGHPMMGHPMMSPGPMMGPGPMMPPTMGPPTSIISSQGAAMVPPPPPSAPQRQPSDTVMLYQQLNTIPGRKENMIALMTTMMKDYSFGGEVVNLLPGNNGVINELPSGYYFNWGIIDSHGNTVQKCHLTLHTTPSQNDVGTLHVRDDETFSHNKKPKPQSIKINIDYDSKKGHYIISMNDNTNPPNARLRKFAEDIMNVFKEYYKDCGNQVTIK